MRPVSMFFTLFLSVSSETRRCLCVCVCAHSETSVVAVDLVTSDACVCCLTKRRLTCKRGNAFVPFFLCFNSSTVLKFTTEIKNGNFILNVQRKCTQ